MTVFQLLGGEERRTYSSVALKLVDSLTGGKLTGKVQTRVEIDDAGSWRPTEGKPIITASGVLIFPELGFRGNPAIHAVTRYRFSIESEYYRPEYQHANDGKVVLVHPYNHDTTLADLPGLPRAPKDLLMLPSTAYPFPGYIPVVRGLVLDQATNRPVENAKISASRNNPGSNPLTADPVQEVLTDKRGAFSLPVPEAAQGVPLQLINLDINADDVRGGRAGTGLIALPDDQFTNLTILIS